MRKIHECAEDIKNILNDAERTEEVDGDMLCSINELVDEILSIYCLEKQQRKMAIAEENEILVEEAKKAGWKSGVAPLVGAWIEIKKKYTMWVKQGQVFILGVPPLLLKNNLSLLSILLKMILRNKGRSSLKNYKYRQYSSE